MQCFLFGEEALLKSCSHSHRPLVRVKVFVIRLISSSLMLEVQSVQYSVTE
jgi:hypothetical protein